MITPANNPAFYFPPEKGLYEVKPGLISLDTDLGNGKLDQHIFQFDNQFLTYRSNKLKARSESVEKYICLQEDIDLSEVNRFILDTLCKDYPEYFSFDKQSRQLYCHLTDEQLVPDDYGSFDQLAMQVQEDLAVMEVDKDAQGKIIALHLCAPNHWAAQDKIGKDFIEIHHAVPEMERIIQRNREINKACLNKGPFVRFAWGLSTDKHLNHHPQPPAGISSSEWQGRKFNPQMPELYMRVERQTLKGFVDKNLILFTIRTYFYDVKTLDQQQKQLLLDAINSMSPAALQYKGLGESKNAICDWLKHL